MGLPSRTLRYYDRIGLVCPPRTASGYRAYGEEEGRLRLHAGHHRSASPSDLLIAACAHTNRANVLHYDHDYDVLADLTVLSFGSRWLAQAGTL